MDLDGDDGTKDDRIEAQVNFFDAQPGDVGVGDSERIPVYPNVALIIDATAGSTRSASSRVAATP